MKIWNDFYEDLSIQCYLCMLLILNLLYSLPVEFRTGFFWVLFPDWEMVHCSY
jgi:hypothetical protein